MTHHITDEQNGVSDSELRALWRQHGGRFHGPNVETGTMPEANLLPFLRGLVSSARHTAPAPAVPSGWRIADNGDGTITVEGPCKIRCTVSDDEPYGARMFGDVLHALCSAMLTAAPTPPAQATPELPIELADVSRQIEEGKGFWCSCTGCHELNDGAPTGPFSNVFQCHLGLGCSECGGLGAIWDDTDYDGMAAFMSATDSQAKQPAVPESADTPTWCDGARPPFGPGPMNASKAAYFMRRFQHEEKLLGPNEQAAIDFVLSMLEQPAVPEDVARDAERYRWLRGDALYFGFDDRRPSPWCVVGSGGDDCSPIDGDNLDAAIDAARAAEKGGA